MARKGTARRATPAINTSALTKGELRKLNALRKSLGDTIADRAFTQWFGQKTRARAGAPVDQFMSMSSKGTKGAFFVLTHQTGVARNVCGHNRCQLAVLALRRRPPLRRPF